MLSESQNMFEGGHAPPFYNGLYNFEDGAQNDIFVDSYDFPLPAPSENQTDVPSFLFNGGGKRSQQIARGSDFASNGGSAVNGNDGSRSGGESTSSAAGSATAGGNSAGASSTATGDTDTTSAGAQTTSTLVEVSTSTAIERSTVISIQTVTATAAPSTVTIVVSATPISSLDLASSATGTAIAFASTTETVISIQSLVPAAAALVEPLGNDESLKLAEFALDSSDGDSQSLPPQSQAW